MAPPTAILSRPDQPAESDPAPGAGTRSRVLTGGSAPFARWHLILAGVGEEPRSEPGEAGGAPSAPRPLLPPAADWRERDRVRAEQIAALEQRQEEAVPAWADLRARLARREEAAAGIAERLRACEGAAAELRAFAVAALAARGGAAATAVSVWINATTRQFDQRLQELTERCQATAARSDSARQEAAQRLAAWREEVSGRLDRWEADLRTTREELTRSRREAVAARTQAGVDARGAQEEQRRAAAEREAAARALEARLRVCEVQLAARAHPSPAEPGAGADAGRAAPSATAAEQRLTRLERRLDDLLKESTRPRESAPPDPGPERVRAAERRLDQLEAALTELRRQLALFPAPEERVIDLTVP